MLDTLIPSELDAAAEEAVDQVVVDLTAARDIIDRDGWIQGAYGYRPETPACAVGAVFRAVSGCGNIDSLANPRTQRAVFALSTTLGSNAGTHPARANRIIAFNDADETTKDDVLGLFDTTISNLSA